MKKLQGAAEHGLQQVRELPAKTAEKIELLLDFTKSTVYYSIILGLLFSLLLYISIFMYGTFYFAFVPVPEHEGPIYPIFEPCEQEIGRCGFLNGSVVFSDRDPVLMTGQPYTVAIIIEMPESPINRQLGMFLNCLQMISGDGKIIREKCKSSMMQYRSELLRVMETFVFAPVLLSGHSTEKQFLRIEFIEDFMDNPLSPAVQMDIQILSRFIEIYNVQFQVHARFAGLRYLMFYYPVISAVFGVALNMGFLSILILLSWYRFFSSIREDKDQEEEEDDASDEFKFEDAVEGKDLGLHASEEEEGDGAEDSSSDTTSFEMKDLEVNSGVQDVRDEHEESVNEDTDKDPDAQFVKDKDV